MAAIMIVEDEPLVRSVSADLLAEAGYDVIEKQNADEAIAFLETHDDIVLVFTDVDMPGSMNGLQLARTIHARWPAIKLLITSGQAYPKPQEIPVTGRFIPKPYLWMDLTLQVRSLLAQQ